MNFCTCVCSYKGGGGKSYKMNGINEAGENNLEKENEKGRVWIVDRSKREEESEEEGGGRFPIDSPANMTESLDGGKKN